MFRKLWIELRSSLWFVPGLLVLAGIGLAIGLVQLDSHVNETLDSVRSSPFFDTRAEGARGMLTAIAGSMITVVGVAFSITTVTLSLASTQYTPRILRNFMRDRANQTVLGVFVSIFAYCLIVLRTIRGGEGAGAFVPVLAVFGAMLLAIASIGVLIFFIHHTAASIQASYILTAITGETLSAVDSLYPEEKKTEPEPAVVPVEKTGEWHPVEAKELGYVQAIDVPALLAFARKHETVLRLELSPGDFALDGAPLLWSSRRVDHESAQKLRRLLVIGDFRTVEQDVSFGIRQIVDIALKALSPGVNDTSTAVSCLDYLSAILSRLAARRLKSLFPSDDGQTLVVSPVPTYEDFVAKALDEIRLSAAGNVAILLQLLCVLHRVALVVKNDGDRIVLTNHAALVVELADRSVPAAYDRDRINAELGVLRSTLFASSTRLPDLPARPVLQDT